MGEESGFGTMSHVVRYFYLFMIEFYAFKKFCAQVLFQFELFFFSAFAA
jgi:hypothetical protein